MLRLTIRALRGHGLRLLLSSLAIMLGVAFIAGTSIFTDGLKEAAYAKAGRFDRSTDVEVLPRGTGNNPTVLDAATVEKIRKIDGVQTAEGIVDDIGVGLVGRDNRPIPGFHHLLSIPVDPALQSYDVPAGRLPARAGELVLDTRTVGKRGLTIGDEVRVGGSGAPARPFHLVGTVDVAGSTVDTGGAFIGLVLADAETVTGVTSLSRITVAAHAGVRDEDLAQRIRAALGDTATVRTHQELLDEALTAAVGNAEQFKEGLLTFALISLFVAAFVIANTFTIVLAQRTREIALLRLIGTTRSQAFRSILIESALVGVLASALGLLAGVGIAAGLREIIAAFDTELPGGLVINAGTVAVALLSGTVVTVLAALVPAVRGTRVPPVAALSDAAVQVTRRAGWVRLSFGALCLAAGTAALLGAAPTDSPILLGAGWALGFLGIVGFGPVGVPAMVRVVGWPLVKLAGSASVVPTLAIADAARNPRRIAATATALVIGIGLVSTFLVSGQSAKVGAERAVNAKIAATFILDSNSAVPPPLVEALRRQRELGIVHLAYTEFDSASQSLVESAHPTLLSRTRPKVVEGNVAALVPGTAVVTSSLGKRVGEQVTVKGRQFTVVAVVPGQKRRSGAGERTVFITEGDLTGLFPKDSEARQAQVEPAAGVSVQTANAVLERLTVDYPTVTLMDLAAYKKAQTSEIDLALGFVTALLGLAVIIALIGVANTLTLSVVERTREHGILRAVGLTRGRLRGMLAVEAVLMAIVGALLGVGLGMAVSVGAVRYFNSGGTDFSLVVPWNRLALLLGVIALAALTASVLPARRAVRSPVVVALGTE